MNQTLVRVLSCMPIITAFLIPIHPRFSSLTLAFWTVIAVVYFFNSLITQNQSLRIPRLSFLFKLIGGVSTLYFAAMCIGMFWTEERTEGWFTLEVKFSFLLLPILFLQLISASFDSQWKQRTKRAFQCGLLTYLGWRFFEALWAGDWSLLRYDGFAGPFHPSYMALYLLTGILLSSVRDALGKAVIVIGGLAIGLLASKAGWGVGILILGVESMRRLKGRQKDVRWLLASVVLLVSGAWWADGGRMQEFQSYVGQESSTDVSGNASGELIKTVDSVDPLEEHASVKTGSTGGRMQAWNAAVQVIHTHPFGVGTGDVSATLAEIYEQEGSLYAMNKNMNPHSIWMQVGVRLGWLALLSMITFFLVFAWKAIQSGAYKIALLTLAVAMNGTVESLFELQQGVVAFLFFGLLLSSERKVDEEDQSL